MNTVTRVIGIETISLNQKIKRFGITKSSFLIIGLIASLFISAFSIVYVKDLNRRLFIEYQNLQRDKVHELIEWGKLLLEQSTLSTQSRIQEVAENQLHMIIPEAKNIVLIDTHTQMASAR